MIERLRLAMLMSVCLCVTLSTSAHASEEETSTSEQTQGEPDAGGTSPAAKEINTIPIESEDEASSAELVNADSDEPKPIGEDTIDKDSTAPTPAPLPPSTEPEQPDIARTPNSAAMTTNALDVVKKLPATPSQDLSVLEEMGQPFGEGYFSVLPSAHRLQLSLALDQALSVGFADSKIGGHAPIFSAEVLMKLSNENKGTRALWLAAAAKPLGVSKAYPHSTRLNQRGQVIHTLSLVNYHQLEMGSLRMSGGVVSQHLGRSDTLYWASLLPGKLGDEALRLFDNALGVNAVYAYQQLYARIDIGQPIQRNASPFASADGLRVQAATGWVDQHAKILVGGRIERLNDVDEQELNLSWQLSLKRFSPSVPVMVYGEIGSITQPEVNEYALGALYAHHELAFEFDKVQLRTRYDWIDRDTYFKYDTTHLLRCALDFQVVQYVNLSAQYRHRWANSTDRSSTENDDVMLFVQLVY